MFSNTYSANCVKSFEILISTWSISATKTQCEECRDSRILPNMLKIIDVFHSKDFYSWRITCEDYAIYKSKHMQTQVGLNYSAASTARMSATICDHTDLSATH